MQKLENTPACGAATAGRGRGRPRAFDRDAALAQAMRLFWTKGFEATSIADLTAAMGIGSPSLYAAFGSKEALYAESLRHYGETYEVFAWGGFFAAPTVRAAVAAFLNDSAAVLSGAACDVPTGCMVTLAAVSGDAHPDLSDLLRAGRAATFERLLARFERGVAAGELPAAIDVRALARFIHSVQSGMSILARDGACRADLAAVAEVAMAGFDARIAAAAAEGGATATGTPPAR